MAAIGAVLGVIALVIFGNLVMYFTFLEKRKKFFEQLAPGRLVKIEQAGMYMQRMDIGFRYFKCDVVIVDETIFLLPKNVLGKITLSYQPIMQLNLEQQYVRKNPYAGKMFNVYNLSAEGRLLSIDILNGGLAKIELRFRQGFDAAKLLRDHNIKQV